MISKFDAAWKVAEMGELVVRIPKRIKQEFPEVVWSKVAERAVLLRFPLIVLFFLFRIKLWESLIKPLRIKLWESLIKPLRIKLWESLIKPLRIKRLLYRFQALWFVLHVFATPENLKEVCSNHEIAQIAKRIIQTAGARRALR